MNQMVNTSSDSQIRKIDTNLLDGELVNLIEGVGSKNWDDLFLNPNLKSFLDGYYQSTGLGVAISGPDSDIKVEQRWQRMCVDFHKKNKITGRACDKNKKILAENIADGSIAARKCDNGLWDIAIPVLDGKILKYIIYIGQFFFKEDNIDKRFFLLRAEKFNFDVDEYITHLKNIPIFEEKQLIDHIRLLLSFLKFVLN